MHKVDNLLITMATALREGLEADSNHTALVDRVLEIILNDFDHTILSEAALCVSVAVVCLRGEEGCGVRALALNHVLSKYFRKFHNRYGDMILATMNEDYEGDNAIILEIEKVLHSHYHTTITSYSMSKVIINNQIAA